MHLVTSLLLLSLASVTLASCPNFSFRCPTGETFTYNTCTTIRRAIALSRCQKYGQNGNVQKWYDRDNGCSVPSNVRVNQKFMKAFRQACGIHDICYATPRRMQQQCDVDFRNNMMESCKFPGVNAHERGACRTEANRAYIAVHIFGKQSFSIAQHYFARHFTRV